jgi:hypothetical protein
VRVRERERDGERGSGSRGQRAGAITHGSLGSSAQGQPGGAGVVYFVAGDEFADSLDSSIHSLSKLNLSGNNNTSKPKSANSTATTTPRRNPQNRSRSNSPKY